MVENTFKSDTNPYFCPEWVKRFLLVDAHGVAAGRVAAFINPLKAFGFEQPTGGIGFFECINHTKGAHLLLDAARDFLASQGMQAMDGPINLGENDNFWGLLVDGFTRPGFGMNYNPPYYQHLFESYGFQIYFEQITNHLNLSKRFPERFWNIARRVAQKPEYHFEHFKIKNSNRYIDHFIEIYNEAWQFHDNFVPIRKESLRKTFEQAKPFLKEELIGFVYCEDEPAGFLVVFPDINPVLQQFKGKMHLWNKLKFGWMIRKKKHMTRARVVVLGIKPKFQRSGLESGLFYQLRSIIEHHPHFKELEISWVGDFNPKMRALLESMGAEFGKKHLTYRYLFSQEAGVSQKAAHIPNNTKYRIPKSGEEKKD